MAVEAAAGGGVLPAAVPGGHDGEDDGADQQWQPPPGRDLEHVGAEERHVSEAIAVNIREMSLLSVPNIAVIIGEGGSGGALGIGVGDRVAMMEFSWYSVISPEGCAAILWKEANEETNNAAAEALALTARLNLKNGLIDDVIEEPLGGAHRDPRSAAANLEKWIVEKLRELKRFKPQTLVHRRYEKLRRIGATTGG